MLVLIIVDASISLGLNSWFQIGTPNQTTAKFHYETVRISLWVPRCASLQAQDLNRVAQREHFTREELWLPEKISFGHLQGWNRFNSK